MAHPAKRLRIMGGKSLSAVPQEAKVVEMHSEPLPNGYTCLALSKILAARRSGIIHNENGWKRFCGVWTG